MLNTKHLDSFSPDQHKLVFSWLLLGLGALLASGLFSILLVLSRTPGIQEIIPILDFFHTALVAHVDLSVLIWFMALSCVFWSLSSPTPKPLDRPGFYLAVLGTVCIALSPFMGETKPLINNYVPVLQQTPFLVGLGLFGLGVICRLITRFQQGLPNDWFDLATLIAAIITSLSVITLGINFFQIETDTTGTLFYEQLFWGSGHILQFSHTVLMLTAWLFLLQQVKASISINSKIVSALLILSALPALYSVLILPAPIAEQTSPFTQLMIFGGLFTVPAMLYCLWLTLTTRSDPTRQAGLRPALFASMLLFITGGVLAFMIEGVNVVIPAHYHGSIVGVSLAFMGLAYALLPRLGYPLQLIKTANWQPRIYAGGQMLHILGLAWSGGYGVQRKTAGAAQGLDQWEKVIGMGMMGMGGLIAIIGGTLFLVVCLHALIKARS